MRPLGVVQGRKNESSGTFAKKREDSIIFNYTTLYRFWFGMMKEYTQVRKTGVDAVYEKLPTEGLYN